VRRGEGKGVTSAKSWTNFFSWLLRKGGDLPCGLIVCLPSSWKPKRQRIHVAYFMWPRVGGKTYGAAGHAIEALLAFDRHVGAVGSLELDVESCCESPIRQNMVFLQLS